MADFRSIVESKLLQWAQDNNIELGVDEKHALLYGVIPDVVKEHEVRVLKAVDLEVDDSLNIKVSHPEAAMLAIAQRADARKAQIIKELEKRGQ